MSNISDVLILLIMNEIPYVLPPNPPNTDKIDPIPPRINAINH